MNAYCFLTFGLLSTLLIVGLIVHIVLNSLGV